MWEEIQRNGQVSWLPNLSLQKKYGIQTGEPVAMALRKCPNLVIVPSDFELYDKCSRAFKAICASFAPVMDLFPIDEVFSGYDRYFSDLS